MVLWIQVVLVLSLVFVFFLCNIRNPQHWSQMNSSGLTSKKRSLRFLNLLYRWVQILVGSALPSRTSQCRWALRQTHLTDGGLLTAGKAAMVKQHQFKVSPEKHSLPSTAGTRLPHQWDTQMLGEKRGGMEASETNHRLELSTGSRWMCLTGRILHSKRVRIKRRWWKIKQCRRRRRVSEEMEEEEGSRAAPCAWCCSLLGKICNMFSL